MNELAYDLLIEVQGRGQAEVLQSYLIAHGIEDVDLFQEAVGQFIYPTTLDILGNVQLFVPKDQMKEAQELIKEFYKDDEETE